MEQRADGAIPNACVSALLYLHMVRVVGESGDESESAHRQCLVWGPMLSKPSGKHLMRLGAKLQATSATTHATLSSPASSWRTLCCPLPAKKAATLRC